jgi:sigma-B regulation protein RsbU (phosphoserine phosphatase)
MRHPIRYIRQHLSLRLGILIIIVITVVFTALFDYLFYRCKNYIQHAAIEHATQLLDNTAERINGIMDETELVTRFMAHTTPQHLSPDSLLSFTRQGVKKHSFLTGLAISMEPDFFPEMGRYFSAYSLRTGDSITTVREGPFEYFDAIWYKTPRTIGNACWVDAYDDFNEGTLSSPDYLISYCCPMRDTQGHYIGSITASLTLKWLSSTVTALKPYPHSSAILLGRDGTYLVHPDTAKLFRQTIFSDAAPEAQNDINRLGHAMLAGRSGVVETIVDGGKAFIFYRPLERSGWSLAIVCPERDVFARYNNLLILVWSIIGIGMIILLVVCYLIVRRAMQPITLLDHETQRIAEGHFDSTLTESSRRDSIGRLQNSFIRMQQSLSKTVANIQDVNKEFEQRNEELKTAYDLQIIANQKKYSFIQDTYHQIRTPLNIISGFAQVLATSFDELPPEEIADISNRMTQSAADINRLTERLEDVVKEDN